MRGAGGVVRRLGLLLAGSLLGVCLEALPAQAQQAEEPETGPERAGSPSGADITRPLQRIDLRTEFTGRDDEDESTVTLRYNDPVPLGDGWQANLRVDLPMKIVEENGVGESGNAVGLGDILLQAIFVRHVNEREGFGVGTQFIMPTASGEEFGNGKWRLRPTVGYRWSLPEISEETFFQLVARYDFSFAGDEDRADVSELQFAPNLEISLPGRAYFSIFPSTDIRYDFETDEFFLPLNLEVGKEWDRLVVSLEGGVGLISEEHAPYDWKLEARIGFRF